MLLVVLEIMSVVLVEVPIGLVGLVGLPVVVGMLSVELMGGSVVGTVLLLVVVGGVMLLLHWALRIAPGGRPNNHNRTRSRTTTSKLVNNTGVCIGSSLSNMFSFSCPSSCLCPQAESFFSDKRDFKEVNVESFPNGGLVCWLGS